MSPKVVSENGLGASVGCYTGHREWKSFHVDTHPYISPFACTKTWGTAVYEPVQYHGAQLLKHVVKKSLDLPTCSSISIRDRSTF